MTHRGASVARLLATAGGVGYSPLAPGTCGTAVAVPLAYLAAPLPLWGFGLVTLAVIAAGIWAAGVADRSWGTHDSGRIVIDEVAGYFAGVLFVDRSDILLLLLAFLLFRVFDMAKPPPIRAIDQKVGGGAGVVLDDVAAGLMTAVVLAVLSLTGALGPLRELLPG